MKAAELYDLLKKTQEAKGFYFNKDTEMVMSLLESLLSNKAKHGYMAAPAGCSREIETGIRTSSAPVCTGKRTSKSMAVAIAISMSVRHGMPAACPRSMSRNGGQWKKS